MLIAREGEEIVCPKGTVCGRITHDANDQITDGDFTAREFSASPAEQRYVCACCGRPVAVREPVTTRYRQCLNQKGWGHDLNPLSLREFCGLYVTSTYVAKHPAEPEDNE